VVAVSLKKIVGENAGAPELLADRLAAFVRALKEPLRNEAGAKP